MRYTVYTLIVIVIGIEIARQPAAEPCRPIQPGAAVQGP
jgi:hypothetical protein|eukprot:SAG25_NODE_1548_length_2784_cov_1030.040223_1_plen_39_part_00